MKRRILDAVVTKVSLCRRGVNYLTTLFKGEGGARFGAMVKSSEGFDERGELLAVVAPPGEDSEGDTFDNAEAIRKSAHSFMQNGSELDLEHDGKALGKSDAYVAESFIIQPGDARFADWKDYDGNSVDVTGGWGMLVQIDSPALRKSYRDGEWDGVSLFAPQARVRVLEKSDETNIVEMRKLFTEAGILTPPHQEDIDMTPEQIAELLKAALKPVTDEIAEIKKAIEPEAKTVDADRPVFKGDPANEADLRKHLAATNAYDLQQSGDLDNPEKVAEMLKAIEDAKVDPAEAREALRKSDPARADAEDELDAAKAKIAKLEKGSNQPTGNKDEDKDEGEHELVKRGLIKSEDVRFINSAVLAAQELNAKRFPATV